MRLIDADALIRSVHDEWDGCLVWDESGASTADAMERIIYDAPTIDPVKHGKWVRNNPFTDTLACSECNYEIPTEELRTPYCPWCGARMDE